MKIRENDVIILAGGALSETQRARLAEAAADMALDIAGVITHVTAGAVTGDDGQGVAYHNIYAPPETLPEA